jgi:HD-like signal output (HDOD) protein
LQRIETLKAVPHVVERVLAITNDESSGAGEMEQVVRGDPNIAAVVLKRANSTYYSAIQKITRVRDAVTRIGFNDVRNIVLALSVMNLHGRESNQVSFDREEFWKASLGTAILAREFAAHLGLPTTEEAFLIGLLADFGCMVLDEYLPDKLEQSICLAHKEMIPLKEAEKRVLGITHAQIGGFVLDRWGFPERVINVISGQHSAQSTRSLSVPDRMLATAVWLGRWSVQGLGIGDKSESVYNYAPPTLLQGLEISSLLTNEFLTDTVEEISSMLEFFKVKVTWPYVFEEDSPEIYIHEVNPPVISPLELTVRRVSSTPVRISKIAKLDELPANSVAIIALGRADTLKEACEGKNWGERPWLFVLPRGQIPKDNSLKERDGLPVGRCDYAEFPFVMTELTCAISRLQASNLQQQEED